ncbi:MAG: hypothetical protein JWN56_2756 [Sphingobacteriales bacterium]|nr:hypothetical protein [Sphingobacteriales bacterium]
MERNINPKSNIPSDSSPIKWVERVSYLMDESFRIPGTNFRFGLDPLLNLIPVLGDVSGFAVSGMLVLTMAKKGVSNKVITLMILNIVLDFIIGGIPIIGNIFDFAYKANSRNIKLLKEHYTENKHQGSGKNIIAIVVIILLIILIALVYTLWILTAWVAHTIY